MGEHTQTPEGAPVPSGLPLRGSTHFSVTLLGKAKACATKRYRRTHFSVTRLKPVLQKIYT
jgi:hypothetical protein